MRSDEAVALINGATFHPDWKISAYPFGGFQVEVTFMCKTYDSSYPDPDGTYRTQVMIGPSDVINVRDLDDNGVLTAVLKAKAKIQEHEDREFLRVRDEHGNWVAPLHPHRDDGNAAWYQAQYQMRVAAR